MSRILAPVRNKIIAHLSDNEINTMIDDYYRGVTHSEIIKKYRLKNSSCIFRLFPSIIEETNCPYCNTPFWRNLSSKSANKYEDFYCPVCFHIENEGCLCHGCLIKKEEARYNNFFKEDFTYTSKLNPQSKDLSITERIYLGVLIRAGKIDQTENFTILNSDNNPLAPSPKLCEEILFFLKERNLINIYSYNHNNILIGLINKDLLFANNKPNATPNINIKDNGEALLSIWRRIAIEECKTYLQYNLKLVGVNYSIDEREHELFDKYLKHYSTAQVVGMINWSLRSASWEHLKGGFSRERFGSFTLKTFEGYAIKSVKRNFGITIYPRPTELPLSQLAKYYFNDILNIGEDKGFRSPISLESMN